MGGAALFVYGTLTDEERLEQLTGRRFPRRRATLEGFARVVAAHGYPTIVPQAGRPGRGVLGAGGGGGLPSRPAALGGAGPPYARPPPEGPVGGERVPRARCLSVTPPMTPPPRR